MGRIVFYALGAMLGAVITFTAIYFAFRLDGHVISTGWGVASLAVGTLCGVAFLRSGGGYQP